ncbi:Protein gir2 [Purpureocillium takamizusanense]|uniref:Protein gir2 n=1 Tax=Purpureocillium takamizusanense TaxID=2060973 RepID=A0A9Q8Q701_9HYPO|nr:Protein gir2 [Purpureocillium takamizusanense]UNI14979.1 Protein gir2 [Purpureocillium takamizusanense]
MGREDQVEEREVLESIFPDEITDISETEYRISVTLDPPDGVPGQEEEDEPPQFFLQVRYPADYPDSAPHLDMIAPPNAAPHPDFSVADDREQLLAGLGDTIQENLGMAMVFTLVSALKEAAEQLIQDRRDAAAKVKEEELLAAEREENKKFHGTPVTPETFLKWREDFLREMAEKEQREEEERLAELKRARVKEPVKLTGRQLWERGLAGKVDEEADEEEDDGGMPTEGMDKLQVEAA